MKRKITIYGCFGKAALETYYCKHLKSKGFDVSTFDHSKGFNHQSILNRCRMRLGDLGVYKEINRGLLEYCIKNRPDILFVFKGKELTVDTLIKIKSLGVTLLNFNPDHPFIRTSVPHGGKNVSDSVILYDIYFTYSKLLYDELIETTNQHCAWLPFGYELTNEDFFEVKNQHEITRACFVGTLDKDRVETLRMLAQSGVPIDFFGPRCRYSLRLRREKNIRLNGLVFDLDFWRTIRQYRVQLNLFRPHNIGSHNQRTFEVPAAGGILLTPKSKEQSYFFIENEQIFSYEKQSVLPESIESILSMSQSDALVIRDSARRRSLESDYSYASRTNIVISEISKIILSK